MERKYPGILKFASHYGMDLGQFDSAKKSDGYLYLEIRKSDDPDQIDYIKTDNLLNAIKYTLEGYMEGLIPFILEMEAKEIKKRHLDFINHVDCDPSIRWWETILDTFDEYELIMLFIACFGEKGSEDRPDVISIYKKPEFDTI